MNLLEAKAAVDAAQQRVQDISSRRTQQAIVVRDLEKKLAGVTSTTAAEEVTQLATGLTSAQAILKACDRELVAAQQARSDAEREQHQVKDRIGLLAQKIAQTESNLRTLNRDRQEAEHRLKVVDAGLASEQRQLASLKTTLNELKCVDAQPT